MPKKQYNIKLKGWIIGIVAAILAACGVTFAVTFNDDGTATIETTIEYAEEEQEATIENEEGKEEVVDVPTVESIDIQNEVTDELKEGLIIEEDAQGAWHDTSSFSAYYNSVGVGNCITNKYGAQCFALGSDFWSNYAGRGLNSCGTGAAKGTINDGCWQKNAGSEFVMIWNAKDLQPGDWVVFTNGEWGHIGMAMGYYNNGYITLFGQNQGGGHCYGGGAATNVINISLKNFGGAFRPKSYIKPAPAPKPAEKGCKVGTKLDVKKGDTMGKIMKSCEGSVKWGKAMDAYAQVWVSTKVKPGQIVYDGWHSVKGVGLYAGDVIERIK